MQPPAATIVTASESTALRAFPTAGEILLQRSRDREREAVHRSAVRTGCDVGALGPRPDLGAVVVDRPRPGQHEVDREVAPPGAESDAGPRRHPEFGVVEVLAF